MIVGRFFGWLFLAAAAAALVWDIFMWIDTAAFRFTVLGVHWHDLHSTSLQLAEAAVSRYIWPPLWHPGIVWVLLRPTWLVFGIVGLALALAFRRRGRRRRRIRDIG